MTRIAGIKFNANGKIYSFDAKDLELREGDGVIAETAKGLEFGRVVEAPQETDALPAQPLKEIVRKATDKDLERVAKNEEMKPGAMKTAAEKIEKHQLPMKLVDCEYAFDGSKLIFYFSAENRVDFRDLVKDLASAFHTRIELRQIGIRDECKMLGGIAPCGRPCCCANHMDDFAHVTVKMAKVQGLSLNPTKISGLCGRLMCCLSYENEHYTETAKKMPKFGSDVGTPDGPGIAVSANMLKESVRVKIPVKDGFEYRDYPLEDVTVTKRMIGNGGERRESAEDSEEEG